MPNLPFPPLQPDDWLIERLRNVTVHDPRYESAWYGPYNAMLSHYFPYQQQFLIKPQPKVRQPIAEDLSVSFSSVIAHSSEAGDLEDADNPDWDDLQDFSLTSEGAFVFSAGSILVPDFIVAKATRYSTHDVTLLVVEVKIEKPTDDEAVSSRQQLQDYMERVFQQHQRNTRLVGLLICGTIVEICTIENGGKLVETDKVKHDLTSAIGSKAVWQVLHDIAVDNWSYAG